MDWAFLILRMKTPKYDQIKQRISRTPFGELVKFMWCQNDLGIICALIKCWMLNTHMSHFSWGVLAFTPIDFLMLKGILIGKGHPQSSIKIWRPRQKNLWFSTLGGVIDLGPLRDISSRYPDDNVMQHSHLISMTWNTYNFTPA